LDTQGQHGQDQMSTSIPIHPATSASGYVTINSQGTSSTGHTFAPINNPGSKIHVKGDAVFEGDIEVKGRSLTETLERIEQRLAILIPNVRLEQDWQELQQLREQYMELERKLLEQQKVFDILKKS
jgi:hypothetical protein